MTFDTWIAKILGSLNEEKPEPRRAGPPNLNPVEFREVRPDGSPMSEPYAPMHRAPSVACNPPATARPQAPAAELSPAAPVLSRSRTTPSARAAAPAKAQAATAPAKRGKTQSTRSPLTHETASGAVRFARTSDADLARRKAEKERIEAERVAQEAAAAAERAEKEKRKPTWVRYTRTPDAVRAAQKKQQQTETDADADLSAVAGEPVPQDTIAQDIAAQNVAPQDVVAPAVLVAAQADQPTPVAQKKTTRRFGAGAARQPMIEILIPRSASMARTEFFLGDAASNVVIEQFDSPDLRRARRGERSHPQEQPLVRSEIERLAELLKGDMPGGTIASERERVLALRASTSPPPRAPEPQPTPQESQREAARMRVRVKAGSQPAAEPQAAPRPARQIAARPDRARASVSQTAQAFEFPALDLLREHEQSNFADTAPEHLEETAHLLEGVLDDFGVKGEIVKVHPGPVVTLYELEPAPGVKSSRVIGVADDIARSMSAISARVAVVQGRNAIGIELPNHDRETVYLRELLSSADFEGSKHRLAIALGKTIGGEPVIVDLARMPHLLVAGTTGSGKSVAINTMILSLLYRLKPEQCRLIMVDPKMLELSVYDGIPHLLTPVVTDPKKAVVALKWAVREMEDRYKKMSKLGVRNIDGFNARVAETAAKGETITRTVQTGFNRETGEAIYEQEEMELSALPYIVVVVDEMADLMMVAGKDIEGAIQRLAQMARAAGIHLIMATQRPSVDVITGTIKANFPTRISFQVTSKIDSRTILGEQGAEQLLGQGDMLYMAGGGRISRVHGPFVSDAEVEKVVAHLKSQGAPDYLDAITVDEDEEGGDGDGAASGDFGAEESTDLYDRAVNIVLRDRKCSVSYIQRRLSVGYNKAASLVERMEKEGVVGQANHSGKREILVGGGVDRGAYDLRAEG